MFGSWIAGGRRAVFAALVAFVAAVSLAVAPRAFAAPVADGVYEVELKVLQASQEQLSMCDAAVAKPAKLAVSKGGGRLQLELGPVSAGTLSGYLGVVQQFPDWNGTGTPSVKDAVAAKVLSTHGVTDEYNATGSSDDQVRGVKYPKTVELEWDVSADTQFIRVYVPIMNAIASGSGWQFARVSVDYSTMEKVGDDGGPTVDPDDGENGGGDGGDGSGNDSGSDNGSGNDGDGGNSNGGDAGNSNGNGKGGDGSNGSLRFGKLADGSYTVKGSMVKVDKTTASMADAAVSRDVGVTVSGGRYFLTLQLSAIDVSGKSGYLGSLDYYKSGYKTGSGGVPQGATAAVKVLSVQESGGAAVSDQYGSDYPAKVKFPLIDEAKADGYVPLRAFIPIMEAIAPGAGTQAMYLKLDRSSVTSGSPEADDSGGSSGRQPSGGNGGAHPGTVLSENTLPGSLSGASSAAGAGLPSVAAKATAPIAKTDAIPADATALAATAPAEKEPPLKGAAGPIGAGSLAVAAAGGACAAFRRRSRFLEGRF